MADTDYTIVYRQVFEEFARTARPNDPLPIRVASYELTSEEVTGEVIESCVQYLTELRCPQSVLVPIIKIAAGEILREMQMHPQNVYVPFAIMNACTSKIHEISLRYMDNEKLSNLPPPLKEIPISYHAIKHLSRKMEDRLICLPHFNTLYDVRSNNEAGYYAIFDGHNGSEAASFAVSHLHQFLAESKHYPRDPVTAFQEAYRKTESRYKAKGLLSGTTAVALLHQPVEKKLIVTWLGDSQAMLVTQEHYVMLVNPHKPDREDERDRIQRLGGCVINVRGFHRVNGMLAVSRAIGGKLFEPLISAEPDIRVIDLNGSEEFVVIGSDGLWDVAEPAEVIEAVYSQLKEKPGKSCFAVVLRRLIREGNFWIGEGEEGIDLIRLPFPGMHTENVIPTNLTSASFRYHLCGEIKVLEIDAT